MTSHKDLTINMLITVDNALQKQFIF